MSQLEATLIYLPSEKMNRLQDKCLELHIHSESIQDWMAIPVIPISLDKIYQLSANHQDLEVIKKLHENIVLPEVLLALELHFMREGIKNFRLLCDACTVLVDPLLALAFTPVDQWNRHLTSFEVH